MNIFLSIQILIFVWNFDFVAGKEIQFLTPNKQSYLILSTMEIQLTDNFILFKVQACNDVHFALINGHTENAQLYEIVIGGWGGRKSVIRTIKQGNPVAVKQHSNKIIDCGIFKVFWISWKNETIKVGKGIEENLNVFLTYRPITGLIPIKDGGVYTAFGSSGNWSFILPEEICQCPCRKWGNLDTRNMTSEELKELLKEDIEEVKKSMSVTKNSTSKYRRTKTSASDDRVSSQSMGLISVSFIVFPMLSIILNDLVKLFKRQYIHD